MQEETMSSFEPVSLSIVASLTTPMLSLVRQASASSSVKGHAVGDLLWDSVCRWAIGAFVR